MKVKLIYPAVMCGRPHVAEVTVECRLTPKQVVIDRQTHPGIVCCDGSASGPIGVGACRFWRHNGVRVGGHPLNRSWRLARGELERLNIAGSLGDG